MDSISISGSRDLSRYGYAEKNLPGRKCPVCGTAFKPGRGWVYRVGHVYFCRWNCQVAWEKAHPQKARRQWGSPTGAWYVMYSDIWQDTREGCKARVVYCEKQINSHREKAQRYRAALCRRQEAMAERAVTRWELRKAEAEKELAKHDQG